METTLTLKTPKTPTALVVGQALVLFGKVAQVTAYDAASYKATAVTVDGATYRRSCYFVEHKNLWRSHWMRASER